MWSFWGCVIIAIALILILLMLDDRLTEISDTLKDIANSFDNYDPDDPDKEPIPEDKEIDVKSDIHLIQKGDKKIAAFKKAS